MTLLFYIRKTGYFVRNMMNKKTNFSLIFCREPLVFLFRPDYNSYEDYSYGGMDDEMVAAYEMFLRDSQQRRH